MTTPTAVDLDMEAYGTYARSCAIADWLELAAIAGISKSQADLEDIVTDNGWTSKQPRMFQLSPEHTDDLPPEEWAEAVLSMLSERVDVLGSRWPFRLAPSGRLTYHPAKRQAARGPRVPSGPRITPYEAVLGISVAHAWKVPTVDNPAHVLEQTVVRALTQKGLRVVSTGTSDRQGKGFAETLRLAARELGLRSQEIPSPSHLSAQDAGVDTLVCIGWTDLRPAGQWIKLGQVTVGQSNDWRNKMSEPQSAADHWRGYLMEALMPTPFLVIPHHIARDHLRTLVVPNGGLVIDRLRLTLDLETVSPAERRIFRSVVASGVVL
jgi:hypothetical protein